MWEWAGNMGIGLSFSPVRPPMGWLIVRLLPYLQPAEAAFGTGWRRKLDILDDSFRYAQRGLGNVDKKISDAFITLVEQKVSFDAKFHYFEPDGSA
jgi:hypothetical protein